jgi:hypothetical protein
MTKQNEDWGARAAQTAAAGSIAALEAAISGSDGSDGAVLARTGLALAPGVAGAIAKLGIQAYSRRLARKIDGWMNLVAIYMDRGSVEAAAAEIEEHIDEEWAHAAVVEGVRAILNDISSVALPFLARVTAHYLGDKKVIDLRGKRLCALLAACDDRVLAAIQDIVAFCKRVTWEHPVLELHMLSTNDGDVKRLHLTAMRSSGKAEEREIARVAANSSFFEALHLLRQFQFAREGMSGFFGSKAGPGVAIIDRDNLDFIDPFLKAAQQAVAADEPAAEKSE